MYDYWQKFIKHLFKCSEGKEYRDTWEAYLICTTPDKTFYKSMRLRRNNFFMKRYAQWAQHINVDIFSFFSTHEYQKDFYKWSNVDVINFIEKYKL